MAWDTSNRKARLPENWSLLRLRVLRRDRYQCQWRDSAGRPCEAPANQVDHIVHGDNHDIENLQALCQFHHGKKSSAEGIAARKARGGYRTQRREPEAHPLTHLQQPVEDDDCPF